MRNFTPGAKLHARENAISLELINIEGTGFKGAVTKTDLMEYMEKQSDVSQRTKRIFTPGAKKLAIDEDISVDDIEIIGTGYKGSVTERDLLTYLDVQRNIAHKAVLKTDIADGIVFDRRNRVIATPLARRMATGEGIILEEIAKSDRKIMAADVEAIMASKVVVSETLEYSTKEPELSSNAGETKIIIEKIPYSGIRKIIGERLSQSMLAAPHVYFTQKVNMDELLKLRKNMNELKEIKLSVTDYISKAVIQAIQQYPDINASLIDGYIEKYQSINLGIAVSAPLGLVVPVIKHAEGLSILEIGRSSSDLIEKARSGKLTKDEYSGGTFTISNLGMFGIENFTAIINPPESAILGISAIKDETVVV